MDEAVTLIDGIGPAHAAALAEKGVHTVVDLLEYGMDSHNEKRSLEGSERDWFYQAKLLLIDDLDKDHAEVLIANGVTIDRMDVLRPDTIVGYFDVAVSENKIVQAPSENLVRKWQIKAVQISTAPLVVLTLTDRLTPIEPEKFILRISGKHLPFSNDGKVIVAGVAGWSLIGKLTFDDRLVQMLDLRTTDQYATKKMSFSAQALAPGQPLVLAEPDIVIGSGMHLEFVAKQRSDFPNGHGFWGKNSEAHGAYLLSEIYTVRGTSMVLDVIPNVGIAVETDKKYKLTAEGFVAAGEGDG